MRVSLTMKTEPKFLFQPPFPLRPLTLLRDSLLPTSAQMVTLENSTTAPPNVFGESAEVV